MCKSILSTGGAAVVVDNKVRYTARRMEVVVIVHAEFGSLCRVANQMSLWRRLASAHCA